MRGVHYLAPASRDRSETQAGTPAGQPARTPAFRDYAGRSFVLESKGLGLIYRADGDRLVIQRRR
jgi:hypothetical protein